MLCSNILIPDYFKKKVPRIFPEKGQLWLDELPGLIEGFIRKWQLTDCETAVNLSVQYICYAKSPSHGDVVLKIGVPHLEVYTGMDALKLYNGSSACRLFEMDRDKGAVLLERIIPGTSLKDEHDFRTRTDVAARLIKKLPVEIYEARDFPFFERQMRKAFTKVREESSAGEEFLSMLEIAERLHERVKRLNRPMMLLHGDLHHENILKDASGEWKAIDPQGRIGEKCLETGRYLLNEWDWFDGSDNTERMIACMDAFAAALGETRETIAASAFLDCALSHSWSLEEGCGREVIDKAVFQMRFYLELAL